MKILFNNLTLTSSLFSTSPASLYPIENIQDDFLKKIYKSTATTDMVTISFPSISDVDCLYIGFTNAVGITLRLYSASSVLLSTKTINPATNGGVFSTVQNVSYATVSLASTENIYLGSIGIGKSYKMPDPLNNIIKKPVDKSQYYTSPDGQTSMNRIPWRRSFQTDHNVSGFDLYNEIFNYFASVVHPVWVEVYEEINNALNPMYSTFEFAPDTQSMRRYSFSVLFTEAR